MNDISAIDKKNNRNQEIDCGKFLCSILVVFLHTVNVGRPYSPSFLENLASIIHKIVWLVNPVEFFFLASSYFIVYSVEKDKWKLRKYIKRLCALYLFWSIFYVKNYIEYFVTESPLSIKIFVIAFAKSFRRLFFLGSEGHMWYMLSMIYGLLLICPLICRGRKKIAWSIAVLCYIYTLVGDSYYNIFSSIGVIKWAVDFSRRVLGNVFLFRGPLFIMLGYSLKTNKNKKTNHVMLKWIIFGILVNLELSGIKSLGTGLLYSTTILKPFATVYFFRLLVNCKRILFESNEFARYSTVIYFLHIFVRNILRIVVKNYWVIWLLSIIICICIAKFLIKMSKIDKFGWLKTVL